MDMRRIQQLVALDIVRAKGIEERTEEFDTEYLRTVGEIRNKLTNEQTLAIYRDFVEE